MITQGDKKGLDDKSDDRGEIGENDFVSERVGSSECREA